MVDCNRILSISAKIRYATPPALRSSRTFTKPSNASARVGAFGQEVHAMTNATLTEVIRTCFVVMGFGKKTDFETGRTLDLDKSYRNIIKPAVEAAGLKCVRADEIVHSGLIDVPMYEQLLNADVVVADLSTSNKNAFYELGVRHALRPYTTVVIAEDGIKAFPFDVKSVAVRQYHHLGEDIGYDEVMRFRDLLTKAIVEIGEKKPPKKDSPVYTFLNGLNPPALAAAMQGVAEAAAKSAPAAGEESAVKVESENAKVYSELMEEVEAAKNAKDFDEAKSLLKLLRKKMKPKKPDTAGLPEPPEDPYIIQQLALVTYKAKHETLEKEIAALREASDLLYTLNPATSNDTETLGLWGAVHKRLWDKAKDAAALDEAIRSHQRGFSLRNDYYNGINFAFLLNVRATHVAGLAKNSAEPAECTRHLAAAIADFVRAQRVREEVLTICDEWIKSSPVLDEKASDAAQKQSLSSKYWVVATKAEAYLGIGKTAMAEATYKEAYALAPDPWMIESTEEQRGKLEPLLVDSPLKYVRAGV
jgi:tetratricopeptide (TPR) repeat protein